MTVTLSTVRTTLLWAGLSGAAVAMPWLADPYTTAVAGHILIAVLLAAGTYVLLGLGGLASLGQSAHLGVGGYAAAMCALNLHACGLLQLAAAIAAATVVAAVLGAVLTLTRGLYFLMLSLIAAELIRTGIEHTAAVGAGNGLTAPPLPLLPGLSPLWTDRATYLYVAAVAGVGIAATAAFSRTRCALALRGVADNEARMQANGHPTRRCLWAAYLIAGVIGGTAGALQLATNHYITPDDLGFDTSALALLAATIGRHSLARTCLAAATIGAVRELAGNFLPGSAPVLLGLLFLAAAYTANLSRSQ